jgi:hypothetical protein
MVSNPELKKHLVITHIVAHFQSLPVIDRKYKFTHLNAAKIFFVLYYAIDLIIHIYSIARSDIIFYIFSKSVYCTDSMRAW